MSPEELALLKRAQGYVVALERVGGEKFFAEVVIVVDEPPTPDVLLMRVEREADGAFIATGPTGESILLSDIHRVAGLPWVEYPEAGADDAEPVPKRRFHGKAL